VARSVDWQFVLLRVSLLIAAGACVPAREPPSRELLELERLAYVPAQAYFLKPNPFQPDGPRWDLSVGRSLVMDLFEVTRRDVAVLRDTTSWSGSEAWAERTRALDPEFFDEDRLDWPAFLSHDEAVQLATLREMRLPTATEWIHVAVGGRTRYYPWGRDQNSVANTVETGLRHPTRVGTFESGRGLTFGCYDLVGNVWEWVEGSVPGYDDVRDLQLSDSRALNPVRSDPGQRATAMGGAHNSGRRRTYVWYGIEQRYRFHARTRDRSSVSSSIGARMCADAEPYLRGQARLWGDDAAAHRRVREVGLRWAQDAAAREDLRGWLDPLLAREGAPPALAWLLEGVRLSEVERGESRESGP